MTRCISGLIGAVVLLWPALAFGQVPLPQAFTPHWISIIEPDTAHNRPVDAGAMYYTKGYCSVELRVRAEFPARAVFAVRGLPRDLAGPGVLERGATEIAVPSQRERFERTFTAPLRHPVVQFWIHYRENAKPDNSRIWISAKPVPCNLSGVHPSFYR